MSDLEIYCHLIPLDEPHPEEDSAPCAMLSLEVAATFLSQIPDDEEEDESWPSDVDFECVTYENQFLLERDKLFNDQDIRSSIEGVLVSMLVPVQAVMVDRILSEARQTASNKSYMSRKVLRLRVNIHVPAFFKPLDDDNHDDDEDGDDDDDDGMAMELGPASKSAVEGLEKVRVEGGERDCAICLERMAIGSEATRLPCSHVYHGGCIRAWLGKSGVCPVCRLEIS